VQQGDSIAPTLFIIAMDPILRRLFSCDSFNVFGYNICSSSFADDLWKFLHRSTSLDLTLQTFDYFKGSGLKINKRKTVVVSRSSHNDYQVSHYQRFLGLHWDTEYEQFDENIILDKIFSRAKDMRKLVSKATLQGIVNYINSYLTPLALYIARVQRLSDDFLLSFRSIVYSLINRSGSSNITIKWDRLTASREVGGYGLLDIEWYNRAALVSWIYLIKQWLSGSLISDAVSILFSLAKNERISSGRLMPIFFNSNHYHSDCKLLDDISWAAQGFETYWDYNVNDHVLYWNRDDSLERKTFVSAVFSDHTLSLANGDLMIDSCMLFPYIEEQDFDRVEEILFSKLYAITNSCFHILPLSPHLNTYIFKSEDLPLTRRQQDWSKNHNLDISLILAKVKKISLPTKTKYIFKDALHLRLRTLYDKDECTLCKKPITGDHFLTTCPALASRWRDEYDSHLSLDLISLLPDSQIKYWVILAVTTWLTHIFTFWDRNFDPDEYIRFNCRYDYRTQLAIAFEVPYDFNDIDV
jgi:hypothetical protein